MTAPILFVGGWGYEADAYTALQAQLGEGHAAASPTFLSHGTRPWGEPPFRLVTPTHLFRPGARGAEAFLPALIEALDASPEPVVLAGWSLGGQLALAAANRRPRRVARLVLAATTPCFLAEAGGPPGVPRAAWRTQRMAVRRNPTAAVSAFRERAASPGLPSKPTAIPDPAVLDAGLLALAETDLRPALARLAVPLHLVHGRDDAIIPVEAAEWIKRNSPVPVTLDAVDGAGHDLPLSRPERLALPISSS